MKITRRKFLGRTAAASTAVALFNIVPRHVLGGPKFVPPSEKVNVALIGAGGQGRTNLRSIFKYDDAQVIAVADPAESFSLENFYYKGMGGRGPVTAEIEKTYAGRTPNFKCSAYEDFRVMLEKEKSIDAVVCATPDHLHAYVSALVMRSGKHLFCEKPLTHNIAECRHIARVARETGVATQMGNIGHSTDSIRETCELIWDGAIGTVREVHGWVGAKRWNPTLLSRPSDPVPTPAGLNWDMWLGPREVRPFHTAYFPVAWRDFWAFGGANIGDFGCHDLDSACWALHLEAPTSVEARAAGPMDGEIGPHGCQIHYHFAERGKQRAVKVIWHDGGLGPEHPEALPPGEKLPSRGVMFVGEKGIMVCGGAGGKVKLYPESLGARKPAPTLVRSKGHHRDWLDACKGGPAASSHIEYGARLTEIVLLGVLSLRTGRRIVWDPVAMEARGFPEAAPFIKEPVRAGWELV